MAFDLEVVFTGLTLICIAGDPPCERESMAYLVNATHERKVCGMRMEGHHQPLLTFDSRLMLPGATGSYVMKPAPDGRQDVVADLSGRELCVRITPPKERPQDLPGASSPPTKKAGRAVSQDHPLWWKPNDHEAFNWIAFLQSVEPQVDQKPYCPQVTGPLEVNEYVVSRVRLQGGTIMSRGCKRVDEGLWNRTLALDYLIWETTAGPRPQGDDFPKSLPDTIVWSVANLPDDHILELQDCAKNPIETLFRLDGKGQKVELQVSNLPDRNTQSMHGPHLEHFRWYYRLLDWDESRTCDPAQDECRPGTALPTLPTGYRFGDGAMWGLLSNSVHCPPGGSGSG